jgi:hypothetical protein
MICNQGAWYDARGGYANMGQAGTVCGSQTPAHCTWPHLTRMLTSAAHDFRTPCKLCCHNCRFMCGVLKPCCVWENVCFHDEYMRSQLAIPVHAVRFTSTERAMRGSYAAAFQTPADIDPRNSCRPLDEVRQQHPYHCLMLPLAALPGLAANRIVHYGMCRTRSCLW